MYNNFKFYRISIYIFLITYNYIMKKIIFTGGGTGGHIMPNLAIINDIKDKYEIKYIVSKNGMEKEIVSKMLPYYEITTCKLKRSLSPSNLLIPFKLIKGICEAK